MLLTSKRRWVRLVGGLFTNKIPTYTVKRVNFAERFFCWAFPFFIADFDVLRFSNGCPEKIRTPFFFTFSCASKKVFLQTIHRWKEQRKVCSRNKFELSVLLYSSTRITFNWAVSIIGCTANKSIFLNFLINTKSVKDESYAIKKRRKNWVEKSFFIKMSPRDAKRE